MKKEVEIEGRKIGGKQGTFIIAEMSANHNKSLDRALQIVEAAKKAGADAIKLQTYTPDTITLNCRNEYFATQKGSLWEGTTLYDLYSKACTPWEWHREIAAKAKDLGIICFSSPFDETAVDFLKELDMPAYKIASYEINDVPLIRKVAQTGKPVIISTGIADLRAIQLALEACKEEGNEQVILLKCTSAYPSPYSEMNLRVIPHMAQTFECITGISDHSYGTEVAVAAVAQGAQVIEKHLTLSRGEGGVDSDFSMEPQEFEQMVKQVRNVESALGRITYELTESQLAGRKYARSLFVAEDIKAGEIFSKENIRSVRPADGIEPVYLESIIGRRASKDLEKGMPLNWEMIEG